MRAWILTNSVASRRTRSCEAAWCEPSWPRHYRRQCIGRRAKAALSIAFSFLTSVPLSPFLISFSPCFSCLIAFALKRAQKKGNVRKKGARAITTLGHRHSFRHRWWMGCNHVEYEGGCDDKQSSWREGQKATIWYLINIDEHEAVGNQNSALSLPLERQLCVCLMKARG